MALRHLLPIFCALLVSVAPSYAAPPAASPGRAAEPVQEILSIATSDGLQLAGLLTLPPGPSAPGAPIVILLPDGPGGSPVRATEPARTLPRLLARDGFAVLSL